MSKSLGRFDSTDENDWRIISIDYNDFYNKYYLNVCSDIKYFLKEFKTLKGAQTWLQKNNFIEMEE